MNSLDRLTSSEKGLLFLYVAQRGAPEGVWKDHGVLVDDLNSHLGLQEEMQRRIVDELVVGGAADWHRWSSSKLALLKLTVTGEQRARALAKEQMDKGRDELSEQLEHFPPRLCYFFFADRPSTPSGLDLKGNWCVLGDPRVAETWVDLLDLARPVGLAAEVRDYVSSKGGEAREPVVVVAPEVLELGIQRARAIGADEDVPTDTLVTHELFHVFSLPFSFMPMSGHYLQLGPLREELTKRRIDMDRVLDELDVISQNGLLTRGRGRSADTYYVEQPGEYSTFVFERYLSQLLDWLLQ